MANRKSYTGFPTSHQPRFYAARNFLKMGIKYLYLSFFIQVSTIKDEKSVAKFYDVKTVSIKVVAQPTFLYLLTYTYLLVLIRKSYTGFRADYRPIFYIYYQVINPQCLFVRCVNRKAARVEVNISLAFLHWVRITFHPWPFVSDIAIFVLKRDIKLQLTNFMPRATSRARGVLCCGLVICETRVANLRMGNLQNSMRKVMRKAG